MFAHIFGKVTDVYIDRAVVEAAGIGYELNCSGNTLNALKKGEQAKILTHMHVGDGFVALYGFLEEAERVMFRRLITVTRVGPKLALAVLSTLKPADVACAIVTENADMLARVPGLGKKTAQRVLLELKEKIDTQEMASAGLPGADALGQQNGMRAEATAALIGLGYDGASAQRAVQGVKQADTIEQLLTQALRSLAKQ